MLYKVYVISGKNGEVYDHHFGGFRLPPDCNFEAFIYSERKDAEDKISWSKREGRYSHLAEKRSPLEIEFLSYEPKIKEVTFVTDDL